MRPSKHPKRINLHVSPETLDRLEALDGTVASAARRAIDTGLSVIERTEKLAAEYRGAGVFDSDRVGDIVAAGLSPEECSRYIRYRGRRGTIGFWIADGDLEPEEAKALVKREESC